MEQSQIEPGIEVNGEAIVAVVDAFKQYPSIVAKYLQQFGLVTSKQADIDRSAWYPLANWIAAYQAIAKDVGVNSLYAIGKKMMDNLTFPPHLKDIRGVLGGMNFGYHLNHRKNGVVMADVTNGQTLSGIGEIRCEFANGEQRATMVCETPYPCEVDRGVLTSFATRFEQGARVVHDNSAPCRKKGASSCTYIVSW